MLLVSNPEHLRKTIAFARQINKYRPEDCENNSSLLANLQFLARYSIGRHKVCPRCKENTWLPLDDDNKPEMTDGDVWDRSVKRVILACDHAVKLEDVRDEPDPRDKTICILSPDGLSEPSFGFCMYARKKEENYRYPLKANGREYPFHYRWFNGGLIFHGPADGFGSGSGPAFAVTMEKVHGWSIHT